MAIKSAINKTHFKCNQNKDYRLVSMQSETQNRNISNKVWRCCKKNNFKHCLNYKGEHEIQLRVWLYSFPPFGYMIKPSQVKNGKESFNSQILSYLDFHKNENLTPAKLNGCITPGWVNFFHLVSKYLP